MTMRIIPVTFFILLIGTARLAVGQEDVTIVAPTSEAAEGLDLKAVSELFRESDNLQEFEKSLNDPEVGVNNMDLDENGEVDFIRVVEEVEDDVHVIILQVPLGKDEFQDVATIEIEKTGDDNYNMQMHGNEVIYGPNYYYVPARVQIHVWPIIPWIYRPVYRPYRSVYYFGYYPPWWRPVRPVTVNVYRTRTVRWTTRTTFHVSRTTTVRHVTKVQYTPRNSTLVKRKTTVVKGGRGTTVKKKTTVTRDKRGTTVKKETKVRKKSATKRKRK